MIGLPFIVASIFAKQAASAARQAHLDSLVPEQRAVLEAKWEKERLERVAERRHQELLDAIKNSSFMYRNFGL